MNGIRSGTAAQTGRLEVVRGAFPNARLWQACVVPVMQGGRCDPALHRTAESQTARSVPRCVSRGIVGSSIVSPPRLPFDVYPATQTSRQIHEPSMTHSAVCLVLQNATNLNTENHSRARCINKLIIAKLCNTGKQKNL